MFKIVNLRDYDEAASFVAKCMPGTDFDLHQERAEIDEINSAINHLGFSVPKPLWLGARTPDDQLAALLHASAPLQQAVEINRLEPNPGWIAMYVAQNLLISEVVVDKQFRRQGLATALLKRAHSRALATTAHPDEFSITAFATTTAAAGLFESLGYTIGDDSQPVPSNYANDLGTLWDLGLTDTYPYARWAWGRLTALPRG